MLSLGSDGTVEALVEKIKPGTEAVNEIYGKAKTAEKSHGNAQPVSDILIAIGLNDRFYFTRELFNNDSDLFKTTITALNKLPDFDEARNYVKNEFGWEEENTTVELFMQIVKRRYL